MKHSDSLSSLALTVPFENVPSERTNNALMITDGDHLQPWPLCHSGITLSSAVERCMLHCHLKERLQIRLPASPQNHLPLLILFSNNNKGFGTCWKTWCHIYLFPCQCVRKLDPLHEQELQIGSEMKEEVVGRTVRRYQDKSRRLGAVTSTPSSSKVILVSDWGRLTPLPVSSCLFHQQLTSLGLGSCVWRKCCTWPSQYGRDTSIKNDVLLFGPLSMLFTTAPFA